MKVTLPKDYRKRFTLEELDTARKIIRDMKDDDVNPAWYAEVAVRHWLARRSEHDTAREILRASAEIEKNRRVYNAYGDDTEALDIWVEAIAKTWHGYLELGAYLTDIWSIGGNVDFTEHMYAQYFTRNEDV